MRILRAPPDGYVELLECLTTAACRTAGVDVVRTRVLKRGDEPEQDMLAVPRWAWIAVRVEGWPGDPERAVPALRTVAGNEERQAALCSTYDLTCVDARGRSVFADEALRALVEQWQADDAWERRNDAG